MKEAIIKKLDSLIKKNNDLNETITSKIEVLEKAREDLKEKLKNTNTLKELNDIKVEYLGKKGLVSNLYSKMSELDAESKKAFGAHINTFKVGLTEVIEELNKTLEEELLNKKLESETIDITLPATKIVSGSIHPLTRIIEEVEDLFISMGYDVVEGPEVEQDLYNFEMLNLPKGHPARDMQDTFYITDEMLLRTQTSAVQAHVMEENKDKTAIRVICPGRVYRRDEDATHSHQFHQIEGLVVDDNMSLADLKGTLEVFARKLFGEEREIRLRPSYFPFTEPSFEVDVTCSKCNGEGCSLCKQTGWIEILGAGVVHPNVLRNCGYDPEKYTGFAFGLGVERIAMLKYGIGDIRNLFANDLRLIREINRIEGGEFDETK